MDANFSEDDYLRELLEEYENGRAPNLAEVDWFERAGHQHAGLVKALCKAARAAQQTPPPAPLTATPAAPTVAQAATPTPQAKPSRTQELPCPALPDLRLAQVAFYDNGRQRPVYDPRTGKRKNAKPQFMAKVQAYKLDPQNPNFNLYKTDWDKSVLMFRHREMPKKLRDWTTPDEDGNTSIGLDFHQRLADAWQNTDVPGNRDRTMFGLFMHTNQGRGFHDHQFLMVDFEHGIVNHGLLFLDGGDPIPLVFDTRTSANTALAENIKGQARFDPARDYFKTGWATCWL